MDSSRTQAQRKQAVRDNIAGWLFTLPSTIVLLVFTFLPAFIVIYLSLFDTNLVGQMDFVGLANFRQLVTSGDFWGSVFRTLYFTVGSVPVAVAVSLLIAVLLNSKVRGRTFWRMGFFIPYITPLVATSIIWLYIFNPDYGMLNAALHAVGLPTSRWLTDTASAMPALILYSTWHDVGFAVIIFMAALSRVPTELLEAAQIDGASGWKTFWHVTWPMISPSTYFVVIIYTISAFKMFTQVEVLTQGGPVDATTTTGFYLYEQAFGQMHFGYASAVSIGLFAIIFLLTMLQRKLTGSKVFYG
jgi:ABC-type sugar transport system permease subunit